MQLQAQMQVSLSVQIIAHKIIFSLSVLLLLYTCYKENVPKCGVHFGWKNVLFELLY